MPKKEGRQPRSSAPASPIAISKRQIYSVQRITGINHSHKRLSGSRPSTLLTVTNDSNQIAFPRGNDPNGDPAGYQLRLHKYLGRSFSSFTFFLQHLYSPYSRDARAEMPLNSKAVYSKTNADFVPFNSRRSTVHSTKGMVSCTQPLAAAAGQRILREGGNAAVCCGSHFFILLCVLTMRIGRCCGCRQVTSNL